jgi:hypothetical protein
MQPSMAWQDHDGQSIGTVELEDMDPFDFSDLMPLEHLTYRADIGPNKTKGSSIKED